MTGLSNQFELFIVFDPSEFEGPKFDCIYNAPSFIKLEFVYRPKAPSEGYKLM